ncbi:hypothetical protein OPV22_023822 [Ensete ventricosum]|uniref:Uncharacterized protein n=1 Tax=Ensete ventricosum TaxID=4639 RepID=A0AAV8PDA6_ENSVE|nr:hypothetical protein OPV22_023822 [Ensete ventricosum]
MLLLDDYELEGLILNLSAVDEVREYFSAAKFGLLMLAWCLTLEEKGGKNRSFSKNRWKRIDTSDRCKEEKKRRRLEKVG